MSRIVLSLLVDNTAGVLSRVAGLFSRRGYNIESLTVGVTADPRYSRMTVVSLGDHQVLEQIQKQLGKLEDVHDIKELREGHSVYRELMLVKVRANANQRMAINAISEIFRASIVDVGKDSVTVMLTGDQSKQDALINLLEDYEILELARTGLTGLSRGADDIQLSAIVHQSIDWIQGIQQVYKVWSKDAQRGAGLCFIINLFYFC